MAIQFSCPLIFVFITAASNSNAIFLLVFMRYEGYNLNFLFARKEGFYVAETSTRRQFIFQLWSECFSILTFVTYRCTCVYVRSRLPGSSLYWETKFSY